MFLIGPFERTNQIIAQTFRYSKVCLKDRSIDVNQNQDQNNLKLKLLVGVVCVGITIVIWLT